MAGNLEKLFQTKLAEAEEKYKSTIQVLTEENNSLRYGCLCSGGLDWAASDDGRVFK